MAKRNLNTHIYPITVLTTLTFQKKTHCIRGHILAGDNAYISKDGSKHCKACKRITEQLRIDKDRDAYNQYHKDWRYQNYDKRIKAERKSDKKRYQNKLTYAKKWYPKYKKELRKQVLTHYGKGILACLCCGETIEQFLTLDHINGGGNKMRKLYPRMRAWMLLQWLRSHNYPKGYQTLCWNCNSGRSSNNGICPHKEMKE